MTWWLRMPWNGPGMFRCLRILLARYHWHQLYNIKATFTTLLSAWQLSGFLRWPSLKGKIIAFTGQIVSLVLSFLHCFEFFSQVLIVSPLLPLHCPEVFEFFCTQADSRDPHQRWAEPPSACQCPTSQWGQPRWSGHSLINIACKNCLRYIMLYLTKRLKSRCFASGQGGVWFGVWENWSWLEDQPRRRGLSHTPDSPINAS